LALKCEKKGKFLIYPDLKIGAIDPDMNKSGVFNSPELQLGERILPLISGLYPIINLT
jgi:hypothetical protein